MLETDLLALRTGDEAPLRGPGHTATRSGEVWLVGAGPGDPELLTLRAAKRLAQADAIVYDHLVSEEILALARKDAARVYAGKESGNHALSQDEINALLVTLARRGLRVLRLKGGDPFMFGRGGEEAEFLLGHGIPFEIVPGVTAASGAACYAGIPLTHRSYAQSCLFVTGHLQRGGADLDWERLARPRQTVVIYMGLGELANICASLVAHGLPATTPAAVIERATMPSQRTLTGTMAGLPELVREHGVKPPALVIIGEVVRLHARLDWRAAAEERAACSARSCG